MSAQFISMVAGTILSLIFSYAPGVAPQYARLDPTWKRLVMLVLVVLVGVGAMAVACGGINVPGLAVTCTQEGAIELVTNVLLALMANQATYLVSPRRGEEDTLELSDTEMGTMNPAST